jgi:hypothetical protein
MLKFAILTLCYGILAAAATWTVTPSWRAALWGGIVGAAAYVKGKLEEPPGQGKEN